ncbi:MAG TPA: hypothetical protein VGZ47_08305 [Gemmataceae bacterium]|jgi:hypothetical protein|nr:hypothetical protein [Gemmataceae bacterium]
MANKKWAACILLGLSGLFAAPFACAQEHCVSGLQVGQKPGPYSFVVSTGKERGQSTCFICQTEDKPAVIVFARQSSEELGKLAAELDKAVADPKNAPLRGWVTFLSDNQPKMDPQVVQWGQKHAIRSMPLGIFEDNDGPPSYRLGQDADVTILLFVKQKVVANFAYRTGELTDTARAEVLKAVPKILEKK